MRRTLFALAFLFTALMPFHAPAADNTQALAYIKSFEYRAATNKAFIEAAWKIVKDDADAGSFLRMAEDAAREGDEHFKNEEYEFALEDIAESNQLALHAVVLAANRENPAIKELVLKEELVLQAKHDIERKETLLRKGMAEVEIFIKTAERLLGQEGRERAHPRLEEAREVYNKAKADLAHQNYDEALTNIRKAYRLATQTVKEIKRAQDDIITFPKPVLNDEKDILDYELKKNASYVFFASKVVPETDAESGRMLNAGVAMKEQALRAVEQGDTQEAIRQFQESTQFLIKAIKHTYKED